MDAYEATKIVYQRIQNIDPENASKIMGMLLIQDHGEKEMIRLAFGPESSIRSVILSSKKELFLASSNAPSTPSTPSSPSPFTTNPLSLSRQNSCSYRLNLPSPLSITTNHSSSPWSKNLSDDVITTNASSPSTMNTAAEPFYANGTEMDLIDELQLQEQLSFLNDCSPRAKRSDLFYTQNQDLASSPNPFAAANWGGADHRRSCSVSDINIGFDDVYGWKPCLYYARGYCKNGTGCPFLHGEGGGALTAADGGSVVGSPSKFEMMEQELMLRSKASQQQRLNAASQLMGSDTFPNYSNSCLNFLMQQHLPADQSPRISKARFERGDFGMSCLIPGSRQIYLTFPADSTFKEEDVSNYFSIFGPVQDVRIPYQQKRMFGFVTFDYPETVKLILAKGNPHFVCDARVLVKPYKEKGKIPEKHRRQGQMERGEYPGCGSPTGLESRDPFDIQIGARMFYNTQDMLWRKKLEEQADLLQAIELQNRRIMNLQLLDVKRNNHHRAFSTGAVISPPTYSPTYFNRNLAPFSGHSSPEAKEENVSIGTVANLSNSVSEEEVIEKDRDSLVNGKRSPTNENNFQESLDLEHNLPDSPFASPKASMDYFTPFSNDNFEIENGNGDRKSQPCVTANNNLINGSLFPATPPSIDMTPFKSCHFQVPRFSSGHETIGM